MIHLLQIPLGPMGANAYIVSKEEEQAEAFIIDPGDEFHKINRILKEKRLELVGILLTHGHFDHIGAAEALRKETGAKLYVLKEERETLENPVRNLTSSYEVGYGVKADVFLKDKEKLTLAGIDLEVIHTPGHTPGGACFYLEKEKLLFSGDTLFHTSVGRSDFPGGSAATLVRSIKERLLCLPEDTKVYPGHMEATDIGTEKKYNPFII